MLTSDTEKERGSRVDGSVQKRKRNYVPFNCWPMKLQLGCTLGFSAKIGDTFGLILRNQFIPDKQYVLLCKKICPTTAMSTLSSTTQRRTSQITQKMHRHSSEGENREALVTEKIHPSLCFCVNNTFLFVQCPDTSLSQLQSHKPGS